MYRLGVLAPGAVSRETVIELALPALKRLGFETGRNLQVEMRVGDPDALADHARQIVEQRPDIIFAVSTPALTAARAATASLPIVSYGPDLVAVGAAQSLARPGGNVTGVTILSTEIEPKRLHVLADAAPHARRIGVLLHVTTVRKAEIQRQLNEAARDRDLELVFAEMENVASLDSAFDVLVRGRSQALLVAAHSILYNNIEEIVRRAEAARLPTACEWTDATAKGCTIGYGPTRRVLYERAADMIAQVLRGTPPGLIPAESPSQISLSVNLAAARALDLTMPPLLLARADEVIE
jgi:putative ABC transport system substrate-binding protein